jgi:hypothetical protein
MHAQSMKPYVLQSSASGEDASSITDSIAAYLGKSCELNHVCNERLFVIARPGTVDTIKTINRARLGYARWFMLNKQLDPEATVFAEGLKLKGEGRIEFYVGSQLWLLVYAPKNKIPNLTCCPDYIPPSRKVRKNHRKRL